MSKVFTIEYDGKSNCLPVEVGITNPRTKATKIFQAIIDTGATNSVVSNKVSKALDLIWEDNMKINGVNGVATVPIASVQVTLDGDMAFGLLKVSVCDLGEEVDALLGMDILANCDFLIKNAEHTSIQMRHPALKDEVSL